MELVLGVLGFVVVGYLLGKASSPSRAEFDEVLGTIQFCSRHSKFEVVNAGDRRLLMLNFTCGCKNQKEDKP
ncbi:MAG: hypothetical protein N3E40_00210 [Dehalococcoidia bacterium]|nr:hypothetical protein [Dehalococcoidia bacterium]